MTSIKYRVDGKLHRINGPAIECDIGVKIGVKEWWVNGERHRVDGPAIEFKDGSKYWYLNGERHREDGPAIERANGTCEYYYKDKQVSEEYFLSDEFKIRLVMDE